MHQDAGNFIMVGFACFQTFFPLNFEWHVTWIKMVTKNFRQGFQEYLPQLVNQMAAAKLEEDQKISYDVILEEDTADVLRLLKNTFFKVKSSFFKKFCPFHPIHSQFRFNERKIFVLIKVLRNTIIIARSFYSESQKLLTVHNNPSFLWKWETREENVIQSEKEMEKFFPYSTQFPSSLLLRKEVGDTGFSWGLTRSRSQK